MDLIMMHLCGEKVELTLQQKDTLDKIETADRFLCQWKDKQKVILMLMQKYGMGEVTAWRYIQKAEYAFGPMRRVEKDYAKALLIDVMWQEYNEMKLDRSKYHKSIVALLGKISDTYGFKFEDQIVDPDMLKQHTNVAIFMIGEKQAITLDLTKHNALPQEEIDKLLNALQEQNNFTAFEEIEHG